MAWPAAGGRAGRGGRVAMGGLGLPFPGRASPRARRCCPTPGRPLPRLPGPGRAPARRLPSAHARHVPAGRRGNPTRLLLPRRCPRTVRPWAPATPRPRTTLGPGATRRGGPCTRGWARRLRAPPCRASSRPPAPCTCTTAPWMSPAAAAGGGDAGSRCAAAATARPWAAVAPPRRHCQDSAEPGAPASTTRGGGAHRVRTVPALRVQAGDGAPLPRTRRRRDPPCSGPRGPVLGGVRCRTPRCITATIPTCEPSPPARPAAKRAQCYCTSPRIEGHSASRQIVLLSCLGV